MIWLGLLGYPLEQSLSPDLHHAGLKALGLEGVYLRLPVVPDRLADAVTGIRALRPHGLNVTIPFKERIIPLLDGLSPVAQDIGAVNTLYWEGDRLLGDNTDALALKQLWQPLDLRHAVVLGSGGAARAACWALGSLKARRVTVVGRTAPERLPQQFGRLFPETCFDSAKLPAWEGASLVVNATPADWEVPGGLVFHDLRVFPPAGRSGLDGRAMLVLQAALALEIWVKRPVSVSAMAEAIGLKMWIAEAGGHANMPACSKKEKTHDDCDA